MRTRILITVTTLAVIAAMAAWWFRDRGVTAPAAAPPDRVVEAPVVDGDAVTDAQAPVPERGVTERDRVLDAYYEPLRFRDAITAFIDSAPERSTAENLARAGELSARIRQYQEAGYLPLPQARFLEGAIVNAVYADDPGARRQALEDLRAEYAARAEAPSTDHLDARFDAYKRREAEIVGDVMAGEPPSGMTRDAWLRQRLDELRNDIYGAEGAPVDEDD